MSRDLDAWLSEQAGTLDRLIAEAVRGAFDTHPEWSAFELDQTLEDTWQLSRGGDCCYDRPSIGPTYASWYHGRRMQDMLRLLRAWLEERDEDGWSLLDLGAGTGATLWALGLLVAGFHRAGESLPRLQVHAIDSSDFMLAEAERMWALHFCRAYPEARHRIDVSFRVETWVRTAAACRDRVRIVASYLFDHSDRGRVPEIARALQDVADRHRARRVLLLGASRKSDLLAAACGAFDDRRWTVDEVRPGPCVWRGPLEATGFATTAIYDHRLGRGAGRWRGRPPQWTAAETPHTWRSLSSRTEYQHRLFGPPQPPAMNLDPEQAAAAAPSERPEVVVGAAGSGKSVVLAERIAGTIREGEASFRLFVTAFNKRMLDQLAGWVNDRLPDDLRLEPQRQDRSHANPDDVTCGHWTLDGEQAGVPTVLMLNWDSVPTRLFGVLWRVLPVAIREELDEHVDSAIARAREELGLADGDHEELLRRDFLIAELRRVVYGLGATTREQYLSVERVGRQRPLRRSQREVVAAALLRIRREMIHRRIAALRRVRNQPGAYDEEVEVPSFTHVFVDECQDFAPADFELLFHLGRGGERLTVAGDLTQSMWLGGTHRIVPLPSKSRWRYHRLAGSYRIPLRVCEAIRPLAERVRHRHGEDVEVVMPESRKAAVLGIRPILVIAEDVHAAAEQLESIWTLYGEPMRAGRVTIVEEDAGLREAMLPRCGARVRIELQSMRRIKGLERDFVVWSTRVPFPTDESEEEWAYTILSRTTSLLVIVVIPGESDPEQVRITRLLRRDRLMPWDERAADWLGEAAPPT